MPEFDEPIDDYAKFFKEAHERTVSEFFEDLVKSAGIDEQQNIKTVEEFRELETGVAQSSSSRGMWKAGRIFSILGAIGLVVLAFASQGIYYLCIAPAIGLVVLLYKKINPEIALLNEKLKELEGQRDEKSAEAWAQMEPLNNLYTWDAGAKLFMKTFPFITFDKYFTADRLADLQETYELSTEFNTGRSLLASQSGEFKANPFVIARYLQHWIGSKTYFGSIIIYWTETVRNAQGNWVTVQRSQTLTASVVKPFPEYQVRSTIVYGHETAPNLSFSRTPSNLSGLEEGLINNWRKDHAIKKVEKMARKDVRKGTGEFTVMSNKEFETLFNATDRDHEVEFRLLFTPLAQQEMVRLLNDQTHGYGDDFAFHKQGMVNYVEPQHLANLAFESNPQHFKTLELAEARINFNQFHQEFFKSVYFGFAPIWTIPNYREERSVQLRHRGNEDHSFWEHEAMANFIGEEHFKHPASATRNILKTSSRGSGSTKQISVTAYGYEGIPQVDVIPMLGGDGHMHPVPVPWTEYIPVEKESEILVGAVSSHSIEDNSDDDKFNQKWETALRSHGASPESAVFRGALAAVFLS
jgi:hypothetical protein